MTVLPISRLLSPLGLAAAALVVSACESDTPAPADTSVAVDTVTPGEVDVDGIDHGSCEACDPNAVCTTRGEAIVCVCKAGYFGDGLDCGDIDECGDNVCSPLATCENTEGGYTCTCNTGYAGDGVSCSDLNECASDDLNDCDPNARCVNSDGSFDCACREGFTGDGRACADVDECDGAPASLCGEHGACVNAPGTYVCDCDDGYARLDGACVNKDECALESDNCNVNATCSDTEGSFACSCNEGFEGDGVTCDEVAGCEENPCHPNASCTEEGGRAVCACNTGYEGDGLNCTLRNACRPSPCDENAACRSVEGVAECECDFAYEGDGFTCVALDGCDPFPCSDHATCTNVYGVGYCACDEGFWEDIGGNCVNEGELYCGGVQTECVASCEELLTDETHCGLCDWPCSDGQLCENASCVTDGRFRITLNWSRDGDGDLFVLTPLENLISWENPGMDEGTDWGFLEDTSWSTGPENLTWPEEMLPPTGVYHICAWAYDFEPIVRERDPVTFTVDVYLNGEKVRTVSRTVSEQLAVYPDDGEEPPPEIVPDCGPDSAGLVTTFELTEADLL